MTPVRRFLLAAVGAWAVVAVAARTGAPSGEPERSVRRRYRSVLIEGVPHLEQKPDFCGEACAAMYLSM